MTIAPLTGTPSTFALVTALTPGRSVVLRVEEIARGQAVQTSEFELPDAEFVFGS